MPYDKTANDTAIRLAQLSQANEAIKTSHLDLPLRRRILTSIRTEQSELTMKLRVYAEEMPD